MTDYSFYIILGLLPSFLWLLFYLRKDAHPEPNSMVLKIFFWGIMIAPLAAGLEMILIWLIYAPSRFLSLSWSPGIWGVLLAGTFIPASVEEYLKYMVVKLKVLKNSEFDEPTDAMLYCIIAALGFAAVENLLVLFYSSFSDPEETFQTITFRFLGATLVHALASGITGYWLAQSLFCLRQKRKIIAKGLILAILIHSCYNYFILVINKQFPGPSESTSLLFTIILLSGTASIVSYSFRKLKKQLSICQINKS